MIPAGETPTCIVCLGKLTDEERTMYEYRCEKCERSHFQRIQRWKAGEPDAELDSLLDISNPEEKP